MTAATGASAPPTTTRTLVLVVVVAGILAGLAASIAPTSWDPGSGRLRVSIAGERVIERAVEVGQGTQQTWQDADTPAGPIRVELPDGVPLDAVVTVRVGAGEPVGLADVMVELELADGSVEAIPVVRIDEDGRAVAVRRPPRDAAVVMGLLAFVAMLWLTGVVELHLPSLLVPVVLAIGGVATASDALAPFFHPIIVLFFAGFLMAEAMRRVGLDAYVATAVVARASRGPVALYLTTLGLAAVLSMWMSNTAAVAVLIPIALAISRPLKSPSYERAVVLGLAYAATVGGVGSAIGTPANPLAIDFLDRIAGRSLTFVDWFAFGLPLVVLMVPAVAAYIWWRGKVEVDRSLFDQARAEAVAARARHRSLTRDQRIVLGVFVAVAMGWLTQTWHDVDTGIVALTGVLALAAVGRLETADLGRINWSALLTFGGGLSLGIHLTRAGVADFVATRLAGLEAMPTVVGLLVVASVVLVSTTVASNTATAAMMIPLAIPLAGVIGVDPTVLVIVVAMASSIDFALVIGTPPTMLAYSTGMFTTREILRRGIVLDVVGILLLVLVVVPVWGLLGVT